MIYCKRCVLPETRPGLLIGSDGVCNACLNHEKKRDGIDWKARERRLSAIFEEVKRTNNGRGFDCVIPVSGGKDSTWQTKICLDYGLRILAVTYRTPGRSPLGLRNLDNLVALGVDHIDYTINPEVERKFMYRTLLKTGSTGVPMHMAMYALPLRVALGFGIPLVIWGENPHMEYGGSDEEFEGDRLDHAWLKRHNILQNTSASDWLSEDLTAREMEPFFMPDEKEFAEKNVRSIFLGCYLPWDPSETLRVAKGAGFQVRKEGPKVGYYNYADIDCDFISVHHHFKWLKFGFTRLFDNLSIEIRNGRMTREEAVSIIAERGDQRPNEDIDRLCGYLRITDAHFREIEEMYRNRSIWREENGRWMIDGFLIEGWEWR